MSKQIEELLNKTDFGLMARVIEFLDEADDYIDEDNGIRSLNTEGLKQISKEMLEEAIKEGDNDEHSWSVRQGKLVANYDYEEQTLSILLIIGQEEE